VAEKAEKTVECQDGCCELKSLTEAAKGEWDHDLKEVMEVSSEEEWDGLVEATKDGRVLVVDFTATWCKPCQKMKPILEALCKERNADANKIKFVTVDVDEVGAVMSKCGVAAMPTFQAYSGGGKVAEVVGADEAKLRNMIGSL